MKINYQQLLWLVPFASFALGYVAMAHFFKPQQLQTPSLVGKTIGDAAKIVSAHDLSLRITAEKEDTNLHDGTIISQTPSAKTCIKERQTIYVVISKKPAQQQMPNFLQKSVQEVSEFAQKHTLTVKTYELVSSTTAQGHVIAQWPAPKATVTEKNIIIYVCNDTLKPVIMPNFKGQLLPEVQEFLQLNGLTPSVIQSSPYGQPPGGQQNVVVDQRPLPGTLVTLYPEKPLLVQLQVANT